jgi:Ca-activated chloride channel family protein
MIHANLPRLHNRYTVYLLFLLLIPAFAIPAAAQDDDVLRVTSNLVQLNVGVVDRQGRAVTNLNRDDFSIYEDGVKQSIQIFEPTEKPFSLVLLLDMSGSTITFRETLKQAAYRFLDALGPYDRVQVVAFNEKIKTLASFTTDRQKIANAIYIAEGKGNTEFYKALDFALNELSKEGNRRKAIVVMTDGIDSQLRKADRNSSAGAKTDDEAIAAVKPDASPELNSVLRAADGQGITIYPLALPSGDPARLALPDPQLIAIYRSARTRMQTLADRTGGRLSSIKRLDDLSRVYLDVAADLRGLYTIAYQPPSANGKPRTGWREIRIEVANPALVARTKPGYFGR